MYHPDGHGISVRYIVRCILLLQFYFVTYFVIHICLICSCAPVRWVVHTHTVCLRSHRLVVVPVLCPQLDVIPSFCRFTFCWSRRLLMITLRLCHLLVMDLVGDPISSNISAVGSITFTFVVRNCVQFTPLLTRSSRSSSLTITRLFLLSSSCLVATCAWSSLHPILPRACCCNSGGRFCNTARLFQTVDGVVQTFAV